MHQHQSPASQISAACEGRLAVRLGAGLSWYRPFSRARLLCVRHSLVDVRDPMRFRRPRGQRIPRAAGEACHQADQRNALLSKWPCQLRDGLP